MNKTLTDEQIKIIAEQNSLEFAVVKAIHQVESKGEGFLADGKPKILFERHQFYKHLQKLGYYTLSRQMSAIRPDLCHSKPTPKGGYGKVSEQHQRLNDAIELVLKVRPDADENLQQAVRECAWKACSWGIGQVMGFNYDMVGFGNIADFVTAMETDEASQLQAMISYLKSAGLEKAMKNKDWRKIAQAYNGVEYAKFNYHNRLASAYSAIV